MQSLTRCDCLGEGGSMGNFGNICKHRIKTPSLAMSRGCGETRLLPHPGEEFGNIHIKYTAHTLWPRNATYSGISLVSRVTHGQVYLLHHCFNRLRLGTTYSSTETCQWTMQSPPAGVYAAVEQWEAPGADMDAFLGDMAEDWNMFPITSCLKVWLEGI